MRRIIVLLWVVALCLTLSACEAERFFDILGKIVSSVESPEESTEEQRVEMTYDDGSLRWVKETDPETGETVITSYYRGGQIESQERIGFKQVQTLSYYESGALKSNQSYSLDDYRCYYREYYENGQLKRYKDSIEGEEYTVFEEKRYDDQGVLLYFYENDPVRCKAEEKTYYPSGVIKEWTEYGFWGREEFVHQYNEEGKCVYFCMYDYDNSAMTTYEAEEGGWLEVERPKTGDLWLEVKSYQNNGLLRQHVRYFEKDQRTEQLDYYDSGTLKTEQTFLDQGYLVHYVAMAETGEVQADIQVQKSGNFLVVSYDEGVIASIWELDENSQIECDYYLWPSGALQEKLIYNPNNGEGQSVCGRGWYDEWGRLIYEYRCEPGNSMYGTPEMGNIYEFTADNKFYKDTVFYEGTVIPKEVRKYGANEQCAEIYYYRTNGKLQISWQVSQEGNRIDVYEWNGQMMFYEYNNNEDIIRRIDYGSNWRVKREVRYAYDSDGNRIYSARYDESGDLLVEEYHYNHDLPTDHLDLSARTKIVLYNPDNGTSVTFTPENPENYLMSVHIDDYSYKDEIIIQEWNNDGKKVCFTKYNMNGHKWWKYIFDETGEKKEKLFFYDGSPQQNLLYTYTPIDMANTVLVTSFDGYVDEIIEFNQQGNSVNIVHLLHLKIKA